MTAALQRVDSAPAPTPPPSLAGAILRQLRPRQWTKNLALYAPLLFAKKVLDPAAVVQATWAVLAFCFLASGVYVVNDWLDREKDRVHPEKRQRPIASGLIGGRLAVAMVVGCWALAFTLAAWVGPAFVGLAAGYVAMQLAYSLVLKHQVILDVLVIALGFVLRVIGGGVAIDVPVSNWLYLCTLLLAVFLGFAKRRQELGSLAADASGHRASLSEYTLPMLDQMITVVAASCVLAYALYTVSPDTVQHVGSDGLKYTVPFVLYGIFRYLFLVHKKGLGGSPEKILLSDPPMIANLVLYLGIAGWALYR
ncbi:MAG: decaprenyl-phosphate phosphoribosyltransferase [Myxococcota bacterium]|nr:decaprenyl-phosphate phosphoribosyltransferase [Myxococcota bacterium]